MKLYKFKIIIEYQDEIIGKDKCISNILYVIANNQKEALEKIEFKTNEQNELWSCSNCLCKFLVNSKSHFVLDKVEHMIEIEEHNEVQKCESCEEEIQTTESYNLVDSTNKVKYDSLCSICMIDLLASNGYHIIINE